VPETKVLALGGVEAAVVPVVATRRRQPVRPLPAVGLLVLGALAADAGTHLLSSAPMALRVGLVLAAAGAGFAGIDGLARARFGADLPTAFWLAVGWMVVVVAGAALADVLPLAESRNTRLVLDEVPRLRPDLFSRHPLGTDKIGFDMLGQVLYGARISLLVGLLAVTVGFVVGGLIGMVAGYTRGAFDGAVGVATDSLLTFPPIVLLLVVVTVVEASVLNIALALAVLTVPTYVRLARANTLTFAQREFVTAAQVSGATTWRIIRRELLPNVVRPVMAFSLMILAVLIVAEASLSFLGVGIQRPTPTWGNMIFSGQTELSAHPHLVLVPGIVMFLTVLSLVRIAERLRASLEPTRN
jgi:peptide/nickel transport system permease protein